MQAFLSSRLRQLMMLVLFSGPVFLSAQQIDWEDDDADGEAAKTEEAAPRPKKDEATVTLNGELYKVGEVATFQRNDSLEISVRDLAPNSFVSVQMKKAGVVLDKKGYYTNQLGELDLLVYTGEKKVKGEATVIYTSSSGKKVHLDCKIAVE
jgi:hypothetical protein